MKRPRFVLPALMLFAGAARADDGPHATARHLPPNRNELVVVPDIGGNSDTGVEVGAAAMLIRFQEGYLPYRFRADTVLGTSFKGEDGRVRLVQHKYTLRLDTPGLFGGRVRADTRFGYLRQVDMPWYGTGNSATEEDLPKPPDVRTAYEYKEENVRIRTLLRIRVAPGVDLAVFPHLRYVVPRAYGETKLATDARARAVVGRDPAVLGTLGVGVIFDTRDNEFVTRRGIFYQLGVADTLGTAENVHFGEASAVLSHYASLGPRVVFASRMFGSFKFGTIPFYELHQGGVFDPMYMVGGYRGVRGVRLGRYAGAVKVVTNTELRLFPFESFRVFGKNLLCALDVFFDAGRVWSDYHLASNVDARELGLKYSGGGGFIFQWDAASIFRVEAAASPAADPSSFPVSFYLENGLIF